MPISRRALLGAGATGAVALGLSGCGVFSPPDVRQEVSSANPFGVPKVATIEAYASGPLGADLCDRAAEEVKALFPSATITIAEVADLTGVVEPRFEHTPPDLIVNAGAEALPMGPLLNQVSDLTAVLAAPSYPQTRGGAPGPAIGETLVAGTVEAGSADGKLVALNYVRVVHGLWYSAEVFAERNWSPPLTWDAMLNMAADTSSDGSAVLGTSPDSVVDLQTLVIDSAIKQGGDEVRLGLENLEAKAWQHPAVLAAMTGLHQVVKAGGVKRFDSRAGVQKAWAQSQVAMVASGSWLDWQTAYLRPRDFVVQMTPAPVADPAKAWAARGVHAAAEQPVVIPTQARDPWGGMELLRAMLSPTAADFLAKQRAMLPVIQDAVPADGFGSPGLASQLTALDAAGDQTFGWRFVSWYRLEAEQASWWMRFASGDLAPKDLAQGLQNISDAVRQDPDVVKVPVR